MEKSVPQGCFLSPIFSIPVTIFAEYIQKTSGIERPRNRILLSRSTLEGKLKDPPNVSA